MLWRWRSASAKASRPFWAARSPRSGRIMFSLLNAASAERASRSRESSAKRTSKEQVLTELGRAASSLRAKLGESLASIQKFDTPIERATTSSLEALRAFTQGRRLHAAGTFAQAVPLPPTSSGARSRTSPWAITCWGSSTGAWGRPSHLAKTDQSLRAAGPGQ